MKVNFTMYVNGVVRDGEGRMIAFYDRETKALLLDGVKNMIYCVDEITAMDVISDYYLKKYEVL